MVQGWEGLKIQAKELGIRVLHRSRDGRKKSAGGGVAYAFCIGTCNVKQITLKTVAREQEIMTVVGKVAKIKKKVVVFVVYIPPNTRAAKVEATYGDPINFVGGDFNKKDFGPAITMAADLKRLTTGPTRGDATLDLVYTTVLDRIQEVATLPPLTPTQEYPATIDASL